MRDVILYIALSLDGYIADTAGGVDWLAGQDPAIPQGNSIARFMDGVDTVILGYTTYHQIATELSPDAWPYEGKQSYVLTHRRMQDVPGIHFVDQPADALVETLRQQPGKAVWICGGAKVVHQLMARDLIDVYHFTFIPTLLGDGIRLFDGGTLQIPLRLIETTTDNGMLECVYRRR